MEPVSLLSVIGMGLTLVLGIFGWIKTAFDKKEKERVDAKKETSDAVASGDIARINAVINRLRH